MKVVFSVERETEKAYEICTQVGHGLNTTHYKWVPKSICKTESYVATVNPCTNKPETYGKRIIEIADWWCFKNLK